MTNNAKTNYRIAECCDLCRHNNHGYDAKEDDYFYLCDIDKVRTNSWGVCDGFEHYEGKEEKENDS